MLCVPATADRWDDVVTVMGANGDAALHHGVLPVFLRAGFREVARPKPARPTVRLQF